MSFAMPDLALQNHADGSIDLSVIRLSNDVTCVPMHHHFRLHKALAPKKQVVIATDRLL